MMHALLVVSHIKVSVECRLEKDLMQRHFENDPSLYFLSLSLSLSLTLSKSFFFTIKFLVFWREF